MLSGSGENKVHEVLHIKRLESNHLGDVGIDVKAEILILKFRFHWSTIGFSEWLLRC